MKRYSVSVNGVLYEVEIEELEQGEDIDKSITPPNSRNSAKTPKIQKNSVPPKGQLDGGSEVKSPMSGKILSLRCKEGDSVKQGAVLFILESMKMENEITSGVAGTIKRIAVAEGDMVEAGDVMLIIA